MSPRGVLKASLVSLGLCAGIVLVAGGLHTSKPPPQPTAAQAFQLPVPVPASATPTRVRIPAISVSAPISGLTLVGTSPGTPGTAVVTVATRQSTAVFHNLGALKRGDTVAVDRTDGRSAVFTIDAVEAYDARTFPYDKVYGASARAELRLVAHSAGVGSQHDQPAGSVVVYAHLTGASRAPVD